jgi:heptosyltransferase I
MRILIIKTTSLGDVIHCLPVIADIQKQCPHAIIDWVIDESFTEIVAMHAGVHQSIPMAARRWRKALFSKQTWCEMLAFKQQLQSQQYDVVIDTQGLLKSAFITYLSKSNNKCGYDKTSARESMARFFYHHCYPVSWALQAVARNRLLAASALDYHVDEAALNYGIKLSKTDAENNAINLPQPFILALHGTSRDSKLWAEENWVELGKYLQTQNKHLVLPWGNTAEKQRAERISSQLINAVVLPRLNLKALARVISKAQAVIGVDTGLAHLAVALGKPTIGIFIDSNPEHNGLVGDQKIACVNLVQPTPSTIIAELKTLRIVQ